MVTSGSGEQPGFFYDTVESLMTPHKAHYFCLSHVFSYVSQFSVCSTDASFIGKLMFCHVLSVTCGDNQTKGDSTSHRKRHTKDRS